MKKQGYKGWILLSRRNFNDLAEIPPYPFYLLFLNITRASPVFSDLLFYQISRVSPWVCIGTCCGFPVSSLERMAEMSLKYAILAHNSYLAIVLSGQVFGQYIFLLLSTFSSSEMSLTKTSNAILCKCKEKGNKFLRFFSLQNSWEQWRRWGEY